MNKFQFIALSSVVVVLVVVLVRVVAFRMLNSPDGERYQKMRAQGPFVPLSAEEIAEDEARIAGRQTDK